MQKEIFPGGGRQCEEMWEAEGLEDGREGRTGKDNKGCGERRPTPRHL